MRPTRTTMRRDKKHPNNILTPAPTPTSSPASKALQIPITSNEENREKPLSVLPPLPSPSRTSMSTVPPEPIINEDKDSEVTAALVPAPTSTARTPMRSSTQAGRKTYVHNDLGHPLVNAGDFYRAIPGFTHNRTSGHDYSPTSPTSMTSATLPSFPSSHHGYDAVAPVRTTGGHTRTRGAAVGSPPVVDAVNPSIDNSRIGRGRGVSGASLSFSSPTADLRSSVFQSPSLVTTPGISSGSICTDSFPPLSEYGRSTDPYGTPQNVGSRLSSASAVYAFPEGKGARATTSGGDGGYHGTAEPMFPTDTPYSPARCMEIAEEFRPVEFELPSPESISSVPEFHPSQRHILEKVRNTVHELLFMGRRFLLLMI